MVQYSKDMTIAKESDFSDLSKPECIKPCSYANVFADLVPYI